MDPSKPTDCDVVVVGPSLDSHGGIASVNRTLCEVGFFGPAADRFDVRLHVSTRDGSIPLRATYALANLIRFAFTRRPRMWILHAHMAFQGSFWRKAAYGWVARARGGKVIYQIHPSAFWDYYARGGLLRRAAIRGTLTRANTLIAISNNMKDKLGHIAPRVSRFVVPNPIDLNQIPEAVPRDPATIIFLGWLVPNKGVFELVDAAVRVRRSFPDVRLVFAGSKDNGRLREHAQASGLGDSVEFPGWLTPDKVAALLTRATVMALPSYSEGVPMAILEALACGTPIIATTVGGIPEVLEHERHALLIAPRDVDALTAALLRVLSDAELRERMSENNRKAAAAFDANAVAAKLRSIYQMTVASDRVAH